MSGAVPTTLYRGDGRHPRTIRRGGGFKSKALDNELKPEGTILQHVDRSLDHSSDPFVSATKSLSFAQLYAQHGYLYNIDSTKIPDRIWDVAAEYEKRGEDYEHPEEQEFSVEGTIPWTAITRVQEKEVGRGWVTLNLPEMTKRASGFPAEDVFVESSVQEGRERVET